ncbi:hypothetical protein [Sphingosinicella terrae]|jgi:hypothetical protein|uniref:hypothetical protein n=1 Tax=Sphingosinicella terrae TaxID=2172047 RepID=UPI00254916DB|nr:hypothetical protein [Sphingosinicella terrae]
MGALRSFEGRNVMATRWRRRRLCVLVADRPAPAALTEVSAVGARLETPLRPPIGSTVELRHPEAGRISAQVRSLVPDGIAVDFLCNEHSVAFALAAIAADMSRPTD